MLKRIKKNSIKQTLLIALGSGIAASVSTFLIIVTLGNPLIQGSSPDSLKPLSKAIINDEKAIIEVVEKTSPAVVSVIINQKDKVHIGGGSGFIISSDGYIVTNKHLVNEENLTFTIITSNDKKYGAKVISRDPTSDIAILKINAQNLPYLTFGNSDKLKVGQTAIAIGNPLLEFKNSVSVGVISGLSRSIFASDPFLNQKEYFEGVIQTDAAINPGNSGGPLLNLQGEVIGVNVALATAENIGFAIPANSVKKAVKNFK